MGVIFKALLAGAWAVSVTSAQSMAPPKMEMSPVERTAFNQVALQCDRDAQLLCPEMPMFPASSMLFDMMVGGSNRAEDPFEELDRIMESLFQAVPIMTTTTFVVFTGENEDYEDLEGLTEEDPSTTMVDHVVAHMASQTHPDDLDEFSERLHEHGSNLLQEFPQEEEAQTDAVMATQRRMARRLTEVAATANLREMQRKVLPFSCPQSQCLRQAFAQHMVSDGCGLALQQLEQVRALEDQYQAVQMMHHVKHESHCQGWHYYALFWVVATYFLVKLSFNKKEYVAQRRLRKLILQTVYSRPALKSAIEKELGESIGNVPPLSWCGLRSFGANSFRKMRQERAKRGFCARFACFMIAFAAIMLFFLEPRIFISAILMTLLFRATTRPRKVRMCTCCCCGATTAMDNATKTKAQACCECCQGTGVCSPACASCCCCSSSKKNQTKPSTKDDAKGCCDDCCCCSTPSKVKDGVKGCCDDCCCCSSPSKATDGVKGCCDDCCCCSSPSKATDGLKGCCDDCCCCSSPSKATDGLKGCCDDCCCCSSPSKAKDGAKGCCDDCCCCSPSNLKDGVKGCCDDCCCCATSKPAPEEESHELIIRVDDGVYAGVPLQVV